MKARIYVVTHKKYRFPNDKMYRPIIAGAFEYKNKEFPRHYIRDDYGDNISSKHDLFSEYTALYWIWKHSNSDIIGLNHYRRYFIKGGWNRYFLCALRPQKYSYRYALKKKDVADIFSHGYDIVLPKKQWRVNRTLKEEYNSAHDQQLLIEAKTIIFQKYPDYKIHFEAVMNSHENYQKCICIMKRTLFNEYSTWIFSIFDELEHRGYSGKERQFAFLGERLMNVWIENKRESNSLRIKELFYANTENSLRNWKQSYHDYYLPKFLRPLFKILMSFGFINK